MQLKPSRHSTGNKMRSDDMLPLSDVVERQVLRSEMLAICVKQDHSAPCHESLACHTFKLAADCARWRHARGKSDLRKSFWKFRITFDSWLTKFDF